MPIRLRLALWYSGLFAAVFIFFGATLYVLMARHMERMVGDVLREETSHLVSALRVRNEASNSSQDISVPPLETLHASGVYVQLLDSNGSVIARSSNLGRRRIPAPGILSAHTDAKVTFNGNALKTSLTPVEVNDDTLVWVQVGASYRQRDMVLDQLLWVMIGGGLGAVGIIGILSWLLASRALYPVSSMAETARAIALSKGFTRRLSLSNPDDELGYLAQTFNEMLASLEEAYSSQQRFTADASHELRAPLTAIRGNLDLLDRVKDMTEEDRQHTLSQARQEVERLSRLVNDLLVLARADSGQVLEAEPVELDSLLVEVHREAQLISKGRDVRLSHLEPAVVHGDADKLKQLLLILVDNAIRYTPKEGKVVLGLSRDTSWINVRVEDSGMGIDPDDLPQIFERFWRADRARSRDRGGTGLGLSIARWIVDQHGGEIVVDSAPGKGSRFTVRLPT